MARCFFLLLLCILPLFAAAQKSSHTLYLTRDSLPYNLEGELWRFSPGDLPDGADTALDDSAWPLVHSRLNIRDADSQNSFKGIGWLRLHFVADSAVAAQPFALTIMQYGASEIYLDGTRRHIYGWLKPKDSAEYYDPQSIPLILPLSRPGPHVLAIRYANWDYRRNVQRYNRNESGFRAQFREANMAVESYDSQLTALVFAFVLVFGLFATLALVHLILFLYYRADRSNGWFSLFAACVATLFLLPCIMRLIHSPETKMQLSYAEVFMIAAAGCSLSALLNGLFSKQKWHFYIVVATCFAEAVVVLFFKQYAMIGMLVIFVAVPLESLIILVGAIWRRVPGARIIGAGLLLLIILLLIVMSLVIIQGDFSTNEDTLWGQIFVLLMLLSIASIPVSMSMYLAWRFASVSRNLKAQLRQVETLSAHAREQEAEKQRLLETRQEELEHEVAARTEELRGQKKKSDDLLLNILPAEIAEELKETGRSEARLYNEVSVLFTDFVDFTQTAELLSPAALVAEIDHCFKAFDDITGKHGLEKIKTVGDAYIAVSGMPAENASHAKDVVAAALEIRAFVRDRRAARPGSFGIRLGVHSGPVVAGIVGIKKFAYDIWGDTVNTAARMEQHSEAGKLNISGTTYELVKDDFVCSFRGDLEVKHKGKMSMYFVEAVETKGL